MIIMVVCCLKSHWLSACFDWPLCHVEGTTYVAHINKPACGSTSAGGAQRCRAATVAPCLVSLVKWCQARNSWVQRTYFQRTWKNIKRFDDFDVHGEFISKTLSCGPENCHCHSLSLSRLEFAKLIRRCWTVTNSTLKTYEDIISSIPTVIPHSTCQTPKCQPQRAAKQSSKSSWILASYTGAANQHQSVQSQEQNQKIKPSPFTGVELSFADLRSISCMRASVLP